MVSLNRELIDNIGNAIFSLPDEASNRLLTAIVNNIIEVYHGEQNVQDAQNAQNAQQTTTTLEIPVPVPVTVRSVHYIPVYELALHR